MATPTPKQVPESHRDLIDRPLLASVATTLPDGTPQVTPIWFNVDAKGFFYFNTARGRLKAKALEKHPYVAMMILDPSNGYRYLAIRGPIIETSETEGRAHINLLSARYTGNPVYAFGSKDEQRIRYKVAPEHLVVLG